MTTDEQRRKAYREADERREAAAASPDLAVRRLATVTSIADKIRAAPQVDNNGVPTKPPPPVPPGGTAARAA